MAPASRATELPLEVMRDVCAQLDVSELIRILSFREAWIYPLQQMLLSDAELWRRKTFCPESAEELQAAHENESFHVLQRELMGLDLSRLATESIADIRPLFLAQMLTKYARLSSLSLTRFSIAAGSASFLLKANSFSHLVELNVSYCSWLNDAAFTAMLDLLSAAQSLRRLYLAFCVLLSDASLGHAATRRPCLLSRLSHLDLSGCSFSNEALALFLPQLHELVSLSLRQWPLLSCTALVAGLTQCQAAGLPTHFVAASAKSQPTHLCSAVIDTLQFLDLTDCDELTGDELDQIRDLKVTRSSSSCLLAIQANPKLRDRSAQSLGDFLRLFCKP